MQTDGIVGKETMEGSLESTSKRPMELLTLNHLSVNVSLSDSLVGYHRLNTYFTPGSGCSKSK